MNADTVTAQAPSPKIGHPVRTAEFRKAFSDRVQQSADNNPNIPPAWSGQRVAVRNAMEKHGVKLSLESISKYFRGDAFPDSNKGQVLAEVLGVDAAWLLYGVNDGSTAREKRSHNALANGAVNLVAGMIQMAGGVVAFPEPGDREAQREKIDVFAIIRGARYSLHVLVADATDGVIRFQMPQSDSVLPLLVVQREGFSFELFEVTRDLVEKYGRFSRGSYDVELPSTDELRQIHSFADRL